MTLVVEDGTGLPTANSYVSLCNALAYFQARGTAWSDIRATGDQRSAALVRATAYIDATYRSRFPGYRTTGRLQGLEWPRNGAYTEVPDDGRTNAYFLEGQGQMSAEYQFGFDYIPANVVPREIVAATCEGALRELGTPGILAPDLERGGGIQSLKAGSVAIEYGSNASAVTCFQAINLALVSLLMPSSPFGGRVARG